MSIYTLTIKNSSASSPESFVIFQENEKGPRDYATVWKVFRPFDNGMTHQFEFSNDFEIAFKDSWGNFTARRKVEYGKQYAIVVCPEGSKIVEKETITENLDCFEMKNDFTTGSVDCMVYRNGLLFAEAKELDPNKKAEFSFKPNIYIGKASGLKDGDPIKTDDTNFTLFNMEGVKSAEIIYTEGNQTLSEASGKFNMVVLERYD